MPKSSSALQLESLAAEWRDEDLFITFADREFKVPLQIDLADRHITACKLNDVLGPTYEVRFLVISHGIDELGFAALSIADWRELEKLNSVFVAENFIDPRKLPNVATELTYEKLPAAAKARYDRLLARNKTW